MVSDEKKTAVTVYLTSVELAKLDPFAKRRGWSRSMVLRDLIRRWDAK